MKISINNCCSKSEKVGRNIEVFFMISGEFFDENLNNLATVARCLYCLLWTELANESNFVILCVMYLWPWGTNMLRPSPWRLLISTNSYKVAAYSGLSGKKPWWECMQLFHHSYLLVATKIILVPFICKIFHMRIYVKFGGNVITHFIPESFWCFQDL